MSDVIATVISVDMVLRLPDETLKLLTRISTEIVLDLINTFVKENKESSIEANRLAAIKLEEAYAERNAVNAYLKSEDAKNLADTLASLQYSDVSATTDLNTLKMYRSLIIELLSDDEDFARDYLNKNVDEGSNMKVAYTTRYDDENLSNVLAEMSVIGEHDLATQELITQINKNKSLFKNGRYNMNKPTVLRKAIHKKDKLMNILHGLDFLIPRLEKGQSPMTWRRL